MTVEFSIRRATERDVDVVIELIDAAAKWLRLKDTDQWAAPWPSESARRRRIVDGLRTGLTWIVWDGDIAAATVSITDKGNPLLWQSDELRRRAVYLHRLVVSRKYAGMELGAALLDWAAAFGRRRYHARTLRIDVWQDNTALHDYYRRLGFAPPGGSDEPEIRVAKEEWPSGAVFERKIPRRRPNHQPEMKQFVLVEDLGQTIESEKTHDTRQRLAGRAAKPVFTFVSCITLAGTVLSVMLTTGRPGP